MCFEFFFLSLSAHSVRGVYIVDAHTVNMLFTTCTDRIRSFMAMFKKKDERNNENGSHFPIPHMEMSMGRV